MSDVDFLSLDCSRNVTSEDGDMFGDAPWLWLVGLGCSVISSIATAIGTILQKKAHNVQQALPDEQKSREIFGIVLNKFWLMALIIMVFIPLPFDFISFALAPQSVIVPMTGLTIVMSALAAVLLLGEKLTKVEVIGTMIILAGVACTTVTSGGNPEEKNLCELVDRYSDLDFLIPACVLLSGTLICIYWLKTERYPPSLEKLKPEMYAYIAGSLGAIMNVLFKATGELAKTAVAGVNVNTWRTIHPYYHILGVVVISLGMLSALNLLLSRVDAVLATPLFFTNLIVCSSTVGLLFYREYADFGVWQWILFPTGIIIVCAGVLFMSLKGVDLEKLRQREAEIKKSEVNRRSLLSEGRLRSGRQSRGDSARVLSSRSLGMLESGTSHSPPPSPRHKKSKSLSFFDDKLSREMPHRTAPLQSFDNLEDEESVPEL